MKASLTEGGRIFFRPTTYDEEKLIKAFPGLYKSTLPMQPAIVDFVTSRLKKLSKHGLGSTKEIHERLAERRLEASQEAVYHPDFYFHTKPLAHQEFALKRTIERSNLGLLLDPGLGKTKVTLDYIFHVKVSSPETFTKALIICPKALLRTWKNEVAKHRPELTVHIVQSVSHRDSIKFLTDKAASGTWDEKKSRWALREVEKLKAALKLENELIEAADVIVMNYAKVTKAAERLKKLVWSVCAVDEALIKDPSSLRTKAILSLAPSCRSRLLLSGTLINQGPEDVFAPVQFLEPSIFGTSFWNFNKHYGIYANGKGTDGSKKEFLVGYRKNAKDEIRTGLELVSIVMSKDEWLPDLPKKMPPVYIDTELTPEQRHCYDELAANFITKLPNGEVVEVDNPLSCLCKLQQISNGFVYYEEEDDDLTDLGLSTGIVEKASKPRKTYFFEGNPKNAALTDFLTAEEFKTRRIVLWYNMGAELTQIEKVLFDLGTKYLVVNGATKDSGEIVDLFNGDPKYRVIVCQAKAVNYGVTLLGVDLDELESAPELDSNVFTEYFYSSNYSLEVFIQQMDRVHRIGVKCRPEYYFSRANTLIEHKINEKIALKQLIRREFLVDIIYQHQKRADFED